MISFELILVFLVKKKKSVNQSTNEQILPVKGQAGQL